jgi:hypothetical protein
VGRPRRARHRLWTTRSPRKHCRRTTPTADSSAAPSPSSWHRGPERPVAGPEVEVTGVRATGSQPQGRGRTDEPGVRRRQPCQGELPVRRTHSPARQVRRPRELPSRLRLEASLDARPRGRHCSTVEGVDELAWVAPDRVSEQVRVVGLSLRPPPWSVRACAWSWPSHVGTVPA